MANETSADHPVPGTELLVDGSIFQSDYFQEIEALLLTNLSAL